MPFFLVVMLVCVKPSWHVLFVFLVNFPFYYLFESLDLCVGYSSRRAVNFYRLVWHFLCFTLLGVTYS